MGTKITAKIRRHDGDKHEYSIESSSSELTLDDFIDTLVIPLLHAAGYGAKSIEEYFGE